jgi:uncharacterized protein YbjT (DUF2867 family)
MICITGATGSTGREIVKRLCTQGVRVRALVRDPEKAGSLEADGVELAYADLSRPETLDAALVGAERVFLLSPPSPRQVELQGNLIEAAKRAGAGHVVKMSALGVAIGAPHPVAAWHAETEQQLEGSGLAWTHLRPNGFMQGLLRNAPTIAATRTLYAPMGDGRVSYVDVRDVAAVAVKALTDDGHEGKAYEITGPEALSHDQVAEKISSAIGDQVTYVDVPPEQSRQHMLERGMPEWLADSMLTLFAAYRRGAAATVTDVVQRVTGRPPRNFDALAMEHAPVLRGGAA